MRLLVCGSRTWTDRDRAWREIDGLANDRSEIVHGCAKGADDMAHAWAVANRVAVIPFPANWSRDGKAAGPIRNARMLKEGRPDRGLAFGPLYRETNIRTADGKDPRNSGWPRTGTGDMVAKMLRAGLPVRWVAAPDAPAVDLVKMPEPGEGSGGT